MARTRKRSADPRVERRRQEVLDRRAASRHVEKLSRVFGREVEVHESARPGLGEAFCSVASPVLARLEAERRSDERTLHELFVSVLVAWNLDLIVQDDARRELNELVRKAPFAADVDLLLARRRSLYPDDRRFVLSTVVQMLDEPGSFHLNVAALPRSPI